MAMFQRSRALLALATALLMTATAVEADARGFRHHRHDHQAVQRIKVRTKVHVDNRVVVNIGRQRQQIRAANTYSGEVAIYYRRGVGAWSYGTASGRTSR